MTDYKKLVLAVAKPLGFDDEIELLEALAEMAANWSKLAGKIDGVGSARALLDKLAADLTSQQIKTAFDDIQLPKVYAALAKHVGTLVALEKKVPEEYWRLLEKVGSFDETPENGNPGLVDWTLIDKGKDFDVDGRYIVGGKVSAAVAFEAGDSWGIEHETMPDPLLRISASGTLGVKGSAKIPVPFEPVKVEAGADATSKVDLSYYFKPADPDTLFALAVAERLPQLPDPFVFDSVWRAFAETDLAGLIYEFAGTANAHVTVSLADAIALGAGINASIGADISVAVGITGNYQLAFRAGGGAQGGGRELRASLTRKRQTSETLALGLGVIVDLGAVATRVHDELKKVLDVWDKLLKDVRPFLSPGTWLRDTALDKVNAAAESLIADKDLRDAVVRDLRGLAGVDTGSSLALADWLSGKITGAFDRVATTVTRKSDEATGLVLDRLGEALPALAQDDIRAKLKDEVQGLVDEVRGKFTDTLGELIKKPQELGKALRDAGAKKVTGAVGKLNDALEGVRELVDKYDKLVHETVDKIGDAAKAKVSARLQIDEVRVSGVEYLIVGTIKRGDADGSRRAFEAMAHGRMGDLLPLFEKPESFPGFELDAKASSLKRFSNSKRTTGFEVVLFGISLKWREILEAKAAVLVSGAGDVRVDSSANIARSFSGPDGSREVSFVDVQSLVLARAEIERGSDGGRTLELGVNIVYKDESLTRGEIVAFLASLETGNGRHLLPPGTAQDGGRLFDKWGSTSNGSRLVADIAAKLWLTTGQAKQLLQVDARAKPGWAWTRDMGIDVVTKAIAALAANGALDLAELAKAASICSAGIEEKYYGKPLAEIFYRLKVEGIPSDDRYGDRDIIFRRTDIQLPNTGVITVIDKYLALQSTLRALADAVRLMGDIYSARPQIVTGDGGWDENAYHDAQADLASYMRSWLRLNQKVLLWFRSGVHPRTKALMDVLLNLAGDNRPDPVTVIVTNRKGDKPVTVALVDRSPKA